MTTYFTFAISVFAWLRNVLVLSIVGNVLSTYVTYKLLWKKWRPRPPARAPNPPSWGHSAQAQLLSGRRRRRGCRPVCRHTFWSSIFLKKIFRRIFVPKAQEKHFMMSRSDFFHGLGRPQHAKNDENACFWAKNNIQNAVGGVCVRQFFFFLKFD